MRAVAIEQAVGAARVLVEHQVLAEEADGQRRALVELGDGGDRLPVAAHQLAHRRAAADAGQGLVVLGAQHGLSDRYDTVSPGGPAMLSREDNELLCRVGPGTPMGNLMRQYWIPAALSSELPERRRPAAARAPAGRGPHRLPHDLRRGRPDPEQLPAPRRLRCSSAATRKRGCAASTTAGSSTSTGQCVDMPSEPAESNFKTKVRATAYPCVERGGLIWAYLGPRATPPPLPDLEPNMLAGSTLQIYQRECNWVQALEGDIDTCHTVFLHLGHVAADDTPPGHVRALRADRPRAALRGGRHGLRRDVRRLPAGRGGQPLLAHRPLPVPVLRDDPDRRAGPGGPRARLGADGRRAHAGADDQPWARSRSRAPPAVRR